MTKQTDISFRSTQNFVEQNPIAQLSLSPKGAFWVQRTRSMKMFCKYKVIYKDPNRPPEIRSLNYTKLVSMDSTERLIVHTIERGVIEYTSRKFDTIQNISANSSKEIGEFDELKDITDDTIKFDHEKIKILSNPIKKDVQVLDDDLITEEFESVENEM